METRNFSELIGFSNERFYCGSVMMLFTALIVSDLILGGVSSLNIYLNALPDDYLILQKVLYNISIPTAIVFSYLFFSILLGLCFRFISNSLLAVLVTIIAFLPVNSAINSISLFLGNSAGFTAVNIISVLLTAVPLICLLIGLVAANLIFKKQLPTVILGGLAGFILGFAVTFIINSITISVFPPSSGSVAINLSVHFIRFVGFVAAGIIFGGIWYILLLLADEKNSAEKSPYIAKKNYIGNLAAALFAAPMILLSVGVSFISFNNFLSESYLSVILSVLLATAVTIVGAITFYLFVYRIWDSIKNGQTARTTPGFAVGGLLIPFYNFYWIFQALPGFAADFNNYKAQRQINTPPLKNTLLMASAGLAVASIIPFIGILCAVANAFVLLPMISQTLNAVNSAKEMQTI